MTWLSAVPMSHEAFRAARWDDLNDVHRRVMGLFGPLPNDPGVGPRAAGQVLFRVEPHVRDGQVLIQSAVKPAAVPSKNLDDLFSLIVDGSNVQLLATLNPVRTVNRTGDDGKVRTHRAHVDGDQLEDWLATKVAGVELQSCEVVTRYEKFRKGNRTVPLFVASFRASGVVCDAAQILDVARGGVGKGRAYGCGLVSVLPGS